MAPQGAEHQVFPALQGRFACFVTTAPHMHPLLYLCLVSPEPFVDMSVPSKDCSFAFVSPTPSTVAGTGQVLKNACCYLSSFLNPTGKDAHQGAMQNHTHGSRRAECRQGSVRHTWNLAGGGTALQACHSHGVSRIPEEDSSRGGRDCGKAGSPHEGLIHQGHGAVQTTHDVRNHCRPSRR